MSTVSWLILDCSGLWLFGRHSCSQESPTKFIAFKPNNFTAEQVEIATSKKESFFFCHRKEMSLTGTTEIQFWGVMYRKKFQKLGGADKEWYWEKGLICECIITEVITTMWWKYKHLWKWSSCINNVGSSHTQVYHKSCFYIRRIIRLSKTFSNLHAISMNLCAHLTVYYPNIKPVSVCSNPFHVQRPMLK